MTLSESWTPLDIDTEEPAIPVRPGPGQSVVGMVAAPAARGRGWSRRAAVEICRGWAQDGSRILLCDVAFENPELHEVAGLYNQEGVSDALLFGSSFRRLGQPLADGFFLATAGTAVPDPAALRSHPRWQDFAGGFTEAAAVLVLYIPSDAPGVEALYELCDTVVVLGERDEVDRLSLSSALGPLATFGPHPDADAGGQEEEVVGAAAGDPHPEASAAEAVATAGAGAPEDGETPAPVPAVASGGAGPDPDEGPGGEAEPVAVGEGGGRRVEVEEGGSGGRLLWLVLAAVLLAVVLNLAGVIQLPGRGADSSSPGDDGEAALAEAAPAPGEGVPAGDQGTPDVRTGVVDTGSSATLVAEPAPVDGPRGLDAAPVARFVLAVASYETLSAALSDAVTLRNAMPEAHFVISPVRVNGRVWYRMSAGAGENAGEAVELRERIAQGRSEAESWQVREAGLAYLVAEYSSFDEAEERVALLAEQGVPGHVLRHTDGDGLERFRVYAGAYRSATEASYMGEALGDAAPELQDLPLVERRGFRPG